MPRTRISIAICTYNAERFLSDQLESFLAQTRPPDEIVVSDNHSTDRTLQILSNFKEESSVNVRINVNSDNLGATKNFEKAIALTTGDVVALSSYDDVWMPEKLERVEASLQKAPDVGLVLSDAELVDANLHPLNMTLWEARRFHFIDRCLITLGTTERLLRKNLAVTYGVTMAFRARFKSMILPIPREWVEDAWIAVIVSSMARVAFIAEPLVKFRQHSASAWGAGSTDFRLRRDLAAANEADEFLRRAQRLALASQRLTRTPAASHRFRRHLLAAHQHMLFRARLPQSRLGRAPLVAWHLLTRRYQRYSDGWWSAAADLLLRS